MDGILVVSYYHLSLESGLDRASAMLQTCRTQLRPVMMTCIVACVGLIPAAFSTGIGSQVQRPLALVVVGGMLLAPDPDIARVAGAHLEILDGARTAGGAAARGGRVMRFMARGIAALCAAALMGRLRLRGPQFSPPGGPERRALHRSSPCRPPLRRRERRAEPRSGSSRSRTCRGTGGRCSVPRNSMNWSSEALRQQPGCGIGAGGAASGHGESPRRSAAPISRRCRRASMPQRQRNAVGVLAPTLASGHVAVQFVSRRRSP